MRIGRQKVAFKRAILKRLTTRLAGAVTGIDPPADIRQFSDVVPRVVFDVGAWIGETVGEYRNRWPDATVYAFEPAAESYKRLCARFDSDPRVHLHNVALGSQEGIATLRLAADSSMNSIRPGAEGGAEQAVRVRSLDSFCAEYEVRRIDFLKIDAEGFDLEVLKGATRMLSARNVRFVQVEAGMNPTTDVQVPFATLREFLDGFGYLLFGVYEQVHEWRLRAPQLRRANCVFISADVPLSRSSPWNSPHR